MSPLTLPLAAPRPEILKHEMKVFFVKYNDPIYVKLEKLDIMIRLASQANIAQVRSWPGASRAVQIPAPALPVPPLPRCPSLLVALPCCQALTVLCHPSGAGRAEGIRHGGGCGFCQEGGESHRPLCHQGGGEGRDRAGTRPGLVAPVVGQGSTLQHMVAVSSQEFASWSLSRHGDEAWLFHRDQWGARRVFHSLILCHWSCFRNSA